MLALQCITAAHMMALHLGMQAVNCNSAAGAAVWSTAHQSIGNVIGAMGKAHDAG